MRSVLNSFKDDIHRPSLPYKFKFKFSGCANDCANSIHRSDMAVIGTWKDDMRVDQTEVKAYIAKNGRKWAIDQVISMCPTRALSLNDDDTLDVDNKSCVRCMHCLNVMTKALKPGKERGLCVLVGGKRTLKIGGLMGTVVVPFMKMESDEDYEALVDLAHRIMEFFIDNALEHERTGEMIERIGLANFLEGIGVDVDPNMITAPRSNSFVRMDSWPEEAAKWQNRRSAPVAAE
ncbi:MAG: sulfite reductase, dissimilatory-type subunit alpha, partial [Magnetospirillum sp.]|nr:sulfite reductase, dissimilatory-type subunit alpha [Magnetospirillum sp.]